MREYEIRDRETDDVGRYPTLFKTDSTSGVGDGGPNRIGSCGHGGKKDSSLLMTSPDIH